MKKRAKNAGGEERLEDFAARLDMLDAAASVCARLCEASRDLMAGGDSKKALAVLAELKPTISEIREYAKDNPTAPRPMVILHRAAAGLAKVCKMPRTNHQEERTLREYAVECMIVFRAMGQKVRAFLHYECEVGAGVATRKELRKVRGTKAAFAQWKKKEKTERENVKVLEVARLVAVAGLTDPQVAKELNVSVSTIERLTREARKHKYLGKRNAGRRTQRTQKTRIDDEGRKRRPNPEKAERVEGAIEKAYDKQAFEEWEAAKREERSGAWDEEEE